MATAPVSPVPAKRQAAQVHWLVMLASGVLAALLGLFLLFSSDVAARIFLEVIGIYWLIAGLVELVGLLGARGAPLRLPRLVGAIAAVASGGAILLSMVLGTVIAPNIMRILVAVTALIMGVVSILVGSGQKPRARGRQVLGVVYALLGILLLLDPAAVPTFLIPLVGALFVAAGGYAIYLAIQGRQAGTVSLAVPGAAPSPAAQQQAMLEQARQDVDEIAQQAKNATLGPKDGS